MSATSMHGLNHIRLSLQKNAFAVEVNLQFNAGQCLALWGPSGSGKTTILRAIAGLDPALNAYINIGGEVWQDSSRSVCLPTSKRSVGFVFQEASIFSHLNVEGNLKFAVKRNQKSLSGEFFESIVRLLDIKNLMPKFSPQLSGGERQRVAIARALLTSPKLLLLDEPLSAVDGHKKDEVLPWLERVRRELAISMVYVTHSLDELTRLADSVAVLSQGRIVTQGNLLDVLSSTGDHFHRDSQDSSVLVEGLVSQSDPKWHLVQIAFKGGSLWLRDQNFKLGQTLRVKINASDVSITTELPRQTSIQNVLPGVILEIRHLNHPSERMVRVDCQGFVFLSKVTARSVDQLELRVGRSIWLQVKSAALLK